MATTDRKGGPARYRTSPVIRGHVHNSQFDNEGVSVAAIDDAELARLREAFSGVTFSAVEPEAAKQ
jgi:hypothetical protein